MTVSTAIEAVLRGIALIGLAASGCLLVVLAALGAADVVSGNLFRAPVAAATEFAAAILPPTVLLALAWSQRQRAHIAVDIVVRLMPPAGRTASELLSLMAAIAFFGLLSYGAWQLALDSLRMRETAMAAVQFPVYPMKIAFATGASLGLLECVRQLVRFLGGHRTPHEDAGEGGSN